MFDAYKRGHYSYHKNDTPRPVPEMAEIRKFEADLPLTDELRSELIHDAFDSIEGWQDKSEDDKEMIKQVSADIGHLAVTSFESPGESDPSYGKFKITRRDIDRLETAIPSQMNPPQPE